MNTLCYTSVSALAALVLASPTWAETLTIGVAVETVSMDPCWNNGSHTQQIGNNIFGTFIEQDNMQRPKPGLAVSWKAVDDKTWEFKVRPGVQFSDGSPFTADDVVFSFNHYASLGHERCWQFGPARYLRTAGKKIKKIDDHTVHVTTDGPHPLTPIDMSTFNVLSKKHAEGAKQPEDFNNGKAVVGAGPYKFIEWLPGDRLVMEANPRYWGGKPKWDRVVWKPIISDASRIAGLLSSEVDIIDKIPPADIAMLRKNSNITISEGPSSRIIMLQIDTGRDLTPMVRDQDGKPMFPNPLRKWEVRKALSKAIDRPGIVERVMQGLAIPAAQVLPDGFFGVSPILKVEAYDPEGARKLLAKVGYPNGFQVTLNCPSDRYINDKTVCEAVTQMWTQIGVKTTLVTHPTSVYGTHGVRGEYSINMMGWGSDSGDPSSPLSQTLHTAQPKDGLGITNWGRYSNRRFDEILGKALVTISDAERGKLYQEATEIVMNDVGMIPLHYQVNTWAMRKGLTYQSRTDERILAEYIVKNR